MRRRRTRSGPRWSNGPTTREGTWASVWRSSARAALASPRQRCGRRCAGGPTIPALRQALGLNLKSRHRYVEAVDAFREALRLDPDDNRARYHLGVVLERQGRFDEAALAFAEIDASPAADRARARRPGAGLAASRGGGAPRPMPTARPSGSVPPTPICMRAAAFTLGALRALRRGRRGLSAGSGAAAQRR